MQLAHHDGVMVEVMIAAIRWVGFLGRQLFADAWMPCASQMLVRRRWRTQILSDEGSRRDP